MHRYAIGPESPDQRKIRQAWNTGAAALAVWVLVTLVNRDDVHGGYYVDDDGVHPTTRHRGLYTSLLEEHFAARRAGELVGVHVTTPGETCTWVVVDIDRHSDDADADANFRFRASHPEGGPPPRRHGPDDRLERGGRISYLDPPAGSGARGACLAPRPMAGARIRRLWDHQAARDLPEIPAVERQADRRLGPITGAAPQRPFWSRVWNGRRWLEGQEGVQAILATGRPDSDVSLAVPSDFDPKPRRPPRARKPRRRGDHAVTAATPSRRDVALARRALTFLGDDDRDDYHTWLRVGMSLRQLGGRGLRLWHEWSSPSEKYDKDVLDEKWCTFDDGAGEEAHVSLGTLVFMATERGFEFPRSRPRQDAREVGVRRTSFTLGVLRGRGTDPGGGRS